MSSVGTADEAEAEAEAEALVESRAASKESVASSGETPVVSWMARRRSASVAESGTVTRSRPSLMSDERSSFFFFFERERRLRESRGAMHRFV